MGIMYNLVPHSGDFIPKTLNGLFVHSLFVGRKLRLASVEASEYP